MNKNFKLRDHLLAPYKRGSDGGGLYHFQGVPLDVMEQLLESKFIEPDDCQNCSPPNIDMIEFVRVHPGFKFHGYAVSPDRDDYRISLEGIELNDNVELAQKYLRDFVAMFRDADEFIMDGGLYCWYD